VFVVVTQPDLLSFLFVNWICDSIALKKLYFVLFLNVVLWHRQKHFSSRDDAIAVYSCFFIDLGIENSKKNCAAA